MGQFKKVALLFFTCYLYVILVKTTPVRASEYQYVTKEKLVYEITSVEVRNQSFELKGWAFINEGQHLLNDSDMEGFITLSGKADALQYRLSFSQQDMTYLMKMEQRRRCAENEYFQPATICSYEYKNVGFQVLIPFVDLKDQNTYQLHFQLHAKKANLKYKNDIFFVASNDRKTLHNGRDISIKATMAQTKFYINHDHVLARKTANKASDVYAASYACSSTYGKDQYFNPLTQYNSVLSTTIVNNVTWYQVMSQASHCDSSGKHYIKEGLVNPTWIASTFIDYNGTPATIVVTKPNTPPVLTIVNPTIYVGDVTFNPDDYVSAMDEEDGIMIPVRGVGNWNVHKVGTYAQQYTVKDSHGVTASKLMTIKVIEKPANTKPNILAKDRTIYQNSNFNALDGVTAVDREEGNLTHKIIVTKSLNFALLGKHELCFYVEDSLGLFDDKCVFITVIPYPVYSVSTTIRFIDQFQLFYKEQTPQLWKGNLLLINNAIQTQLPMISSIID